jgi:hypothetical protein
MRLVAPYWHSAPEEEMARCGKKRGSQAFAARTPHSAPIRKMASCGKIPREVATLGFWQRNGALCFGFPDRRNCLHCTSDTHTCHTRSAPPFWRAVVMDGQSRSTSIRPSRVEGGTNVSRYKNWQHLKLWTFVPLRLRNTPPWGAVGRFPPREGIGGGPKERGSLAARPPPPAKDNWRKGSNSSRETHV